MATLVELLNAMPPAKVANILARFDSFWGHPYGPINRPSMRKLFDACGTRGLQAALSTMDPWTELHLRRFVLDMSAFVANDGTASPLNSALISALVSAHRERARKEYTENLAFELANSPHLRHDLERTLSSMNERSFVFYAERSVSQLDTEAHAQLLAKEAEEFEQELLEEELQRKDCLNTDSVPPDAKRRRVERSSSF